jgi:hypothetical protein
VLGWVEVLVGAVGARDEGAAARLVEVVRQWIGASYLRRPQPVEAGVDDDPVQPRRNRRVAAEAAGPPERRDQPVLEAVGGLLAIAGRAQGDRPEPVAVTGEELAERLWIARDVRGEQLGVAA